MPKFFVQNMSNPVESDLYLGVVVEVPNDSAAIALDLFLEQYPAEGGDQFTVVAENGVAAFEAVETIDIEPGDFDAGDAEIPVP